MEEYEEAREETREDFLKGTGGFGFPSPRDVALHTEVETGGRAKAPGEGG